MSYSTPPGSGGQMPPTPPRSDIDFSVIGDGFTLLFRHWQVYVIPGLITLVIGTPYFFVATVPSIRQLFGGPTPDPLANLGLELVLLFVQFVVSLLLYPGIVQYTLNVIRGTNPTRDDLWVGFRDPLGYLALGILLILAHTVGFFVCCVGILVVAGMMMFAIPIKVDQGVTASDAMARSWEMVKSNWLMAALFMLVVGILSSLGQCVCYVGYALTMPFYYIAPTIVYQQFIGFGGTPGSSASPYPRGGEYGHGIGGQQQPPSEQGRPPQPEDMR